MYDHAVEPILEVALHACAMLFDAAVGNEKNAPESGVGSVGGITLSTGSGVSFEHADADTVEINVLGVPKGETRGIVDSLVAATSGDRIITAKRHGANVTVKVSPVMDVAEFASEIEFGRVFSICDRLITVDYAERRLWGCDTVVLPLGG